jgi:release factor glutamine methyltransferase
LISNRLKLLKSDLFEILKQIQDEALKYDLIISNPPYIPSKEIEDLEPEVRIHEPKIALDGGSDGLDFYRKISASAENFLNKNGKIILEIGFGQKEKIVQIFSENKFRLIDSKTDLAGIDRALCFDLVICHQQVQCHAEPVEA